MLSTLFQKDGLKLDWTISLGNLVQIILLIAAIAELYVRINERLVKLEESKETLNKLEEKLDALASLEAKVNMMYEWWQKKIERRYDTRPS